MKIIVNAASAYVGGALNYVTNFVSELSKLNSSDEYLVFTPQKGSLSVGSDVSRVKVIHVDFSASSFLKRLWFEQITLRRLIRSEHIDVLYSTANFGMIACPCFQILLVRNALYFSDLFCQLTFQPLRLVSGLKNIIRRWAVYFSILSSDVVITPSFAMKDMIINVFPRLSMKTIRVIHYGFDSRDYENYSRALPEDIDRHFRKYEGRRIKLLWVGYPALHKGVRVLFEAVANIKIYCPEVILYITMETKSGVDDNRAGIRGLDRMIHNYLNEISCLNINDNIACVGWVPSEFLHSIYGKCDVFVFPSLCESFGFPMVEAMARGVPIVAADTPINREILGGAALFYSALSSCELADAIESIMADRLLRERLCDNARRRMAEYDWSWKRYVSEFTGMINESGR